MAMIKDRDCNNTSDDDDDNDDEDDDGDYERFTSQCAEYGGGGGGSGGCSHNGPPVKIMVSKNILAVTITMMTAGDDDFSGLLICAFTKTGSSKFFSRLYRPRLPLPRGMGTITPEKHFDTNT